MSISKPKTCSDNDWYDLIASKRFRNVKRKLQKYQKHWKIKKNKKIFTLIFIFCFGSLTCVIDVEVVSQSNISSDWELNLYIDDKCILLPEF